jgi:hypothetical protein
MFDQVMDVALFRVPVIPGLCAQKKVQAGKKWVSVFKLRSKAVLI